jgi:hypothetical protein
VGDHDDVRGLEDPVQLFDGGLLFRSVHCKLFQVWRSARFAETPVETTAPLKFTRTGARTALKKPAP